FPWRPSHSCAIMILGKQFFFITAALAAWASAVPPLNPPTSIVSSLPSGAVLSSNDTVIDDPDPEKLPPLEGPGVTLDPSDCHADDQNNIARSVPKASKGWQVVETQEVKLARARIQRLQRSLKLNPKSPPEHSLKKQWITTCAPYWTYCTINSGFFKKHLMVQTSNVNVFFVRNIDAQISSPPQAVTNLKSTKAIAVMRSRTVGWKVGVKATVSGTGKGVTGTLEASAEYSNTNTAGRTVTTTNERSITCPKGKRCSFQTWSFHVRIKGKCRQQQWVHCSGETNMCAPFQQRWWFPHTNWNACAAFKRRYERGCLSAQSKRLVDCEFEVPILNSAGNQLVEQHTILEKRI
ncbi:hypothetical protein LOZ61_005935, partial [Ophidiomyces ophidiicola]